MICSVCKGNMAENTTAFMSDSNNKIIVIKNVPCHKCTQCGEESFSSEVTERLEKIIDSFEESLTEVAIISYSSA